MLTISYSSETCVQQGLTRQLTVRVDNKRVNLTGQGDKRVWLQNDD